MDLLSGITTLLRSEFVDEAGAGFPTLRQIPCTALVKFLDYYDSLALEERNSLLDVLALAGAMRFFPPPRINQEYQSLRTSNAAFAKFQATIQSQLFGFGLRYSGVKMTKLMLSDAETVAEMEKSRAKLDWKPRDDPPPGLVSDPDFRHLQPAKAPLLRKLVGAAFESLFCAEKKKLVGGETGYMGILEGAKVTVWVDFGSSLAQLRYGISIPEAGPKLLISRLSFEDLWMTSLGWDYLTEENASKCIQRLCENLRYLVQLGRRIALLPVS